MVTGTPGVGKSRLARGLSRSEGFTHVDLSRMVRKERLYTRFDRTRGSYVLNESRIRRRLEVISESPKKIIITYHTVGKFLPEHRVRCALVLRLDPAILYRRLRARSWTRRKAWENTEAEILDSSLQGAMRLLGKGRVYEIDTTKKSARHVHREALMVLSRSTKSRGGHVNWLSLYDPVELEKNYD